MFAKEMNYFSGPVIWAVVVITTFLNVLPQAAYARDKAKVERQFQNWLVKDFWPAARKAGISSKTYNSAIKGLKLQWKLPDIVVPGEKIKAKRKQSQAEFKAPSYYFNERSLQAQANTGRKIARKHAAIIKKIERKYGVPGHFLIAIWGRESAFGKAKIPHSALRVLATKAFMSTRKPLFQKEFLAALTILQKGYAGKSDLKSSWAGAMGQPQFMPSSYLQYAVDFDGDGRKDIWRSVPDTLASMANYLSQKGWTRGRDWGFEVRIPKKISCAQEGSDRSRKISKWQQMGIGRISGKAFPAGELTKQGMMLVPAGRNGPHFIVTDNFYTIKAYNNSDLYALFVGNLGDRIAYGSKAFVSSWQSQDKMLRSDIARMQRRLEKSGYDVGGADGLPGFKTRRSIGDWQISRGKPSSCFPDRALLKQLQ